MSKSTPTISLPFTTYDAEPAQKPWYNVFSGSRLRNRILALVATTSLFLIGVLLLRQSFFGVSNSSISGLSQHASTSSLPLQNYEGVDIQNVDPENLVIVAGHAIWLEGKSYANDSDWVLEAFQYGETMTFVEHIRKGAQLAKKTPHSVLIFSGGNTRPHANARTESQSYAALLELLAKSDESLRLDFVTTEEFARDSYENLIFSIARFYEVVGRYPKTISVVGYSFKEQRFKDLHRKALNFPAKDFFYYGVDPAGLDSAGLEGEYNNAISHFEADWYGCKDAELLRKKKLRNPFRRRHGYEISNPLLAELLAYCPTKGDTPFPGKLPWA